MQIPAIVVSCSINKSSVKFLLSQLAGVKNVYVGSSYIAIDYIPEYEKTLIQALSSIKGVSNPVKKEVSLFSLSAIQIPEDKEGYYVEGVRLPKAFVPQQPITSLTLEENSDILTPISTISPTSLISKDETETLIPKNEVEVISLISKDGTEASAISKNDKKDTDKLEATPSSIEDIIYQ